MLGNSEAPFAATSASVALRGPACAASVGAGLPLRTGASTGVAVCLAPERHPPGGRRICCCSSCRRQDPRTSLCEEASANRSIVSSSCRPRYELRYPSDGQSQFSVVAGAGAWTCRFGPSGPSGPRASTPSASEGSKSCPRNHAPRTAVPPPAAFLCASAPCAGSTMISASSRPEAAALLAHRTRTRSMSQRDLRRLVAAPPGSASTSSSQRRKRI